MSNHFCIHIALSSATTSPDVFPAEVQSIAYNAFDKVTSITEGDKSLQITYGHHRQRIGAYSVTLPPKASCNLC